MGIKRIRRVTVEIEHRSISITQTESRSVGPAVDIPRVCSTCGATLVLVIPDMDAGAAAHLPRIFHMLLQRGLHSYFSVEGQLWVCSRSFQELSEVL